MAKVKTASPSSSTQNLRPPLTPEAKEKQMVSLAMDLVEQRLRDGTASSQETTHFLKLATNKSRLENELLASQRELAAAKVEAIKAEKHREELFKEAIAAMKSYSGRGESDESEDD